MTNITELTKATKSNDEAVETRRCLMCGNDFNSEGVHNHICRRCKSTQTWRQG